MFILLMRSVGCMIGGYGINRSVSKAFEQSFTVFPGYLLKDCEFDELVNAIRLVMTNKTYISPAISDVVVDNYMRQPANAKDSAFSILSQREREVLQLLTEGKATKQIGKRLHISAKTVEVHRLNLMNKLKIDNIAQLTKYAVQEGLTRPEP